MLLTHKWLNDTSNLLFLFCEYCGRASSLVIPAPLYRDRQMHILGHQHPEPSVPAQSMEKGMENTSSCPSLSHISSNRQFQLTSSTLCQLLVKCGSNAGKVSINHGSMFVQIWFKCFSTVGQSCIKSGSSIGQSSEKLLANSAAIVGQSCVTHSSNMVQKCVNGVSIDRQLCVNCGVNCGSIMGQSWVNYGSILGQVWVNHASIMDQS